ncbi:hypothetical protein EYF80_011094 [Liparis tanakae]|uniref:Uncharacterized protein n=1 Tax=Liparis tanakae TaxID=230148 RepID=A0A4Z2IKX0_9TELE|nr:hypothetical protein EYF80_011094 [Liparis tanakae]
MSQGLEYSRLALGEEEAKVVLKRGHGGADGGGAKAVSDEAEVGQAALDSRLHDGGRPRVPQRRTVLSQQVGRDIPAAANNNYPVKLHCATE